MTETLGLHCIRTDGGTQARAQTDWLVVDEYVHAMKEGAIFPPVVVFFDGTTHWLADGFHRVEAARRAGVDELAADIRRGTQRDAVLWACGANAAHGLRRTNTDKRRAVMTLLHDETWRCNSDPWIADKCAVTQPFVLKVRKELGYNGYNPDDEKRTGKDGKQQAAKKTRPEPAPAPEPELFSEGKREDDNGDPTVLLAEDMPCPICLTPLRIVDGGAHTGWLRCVSCAYETPIVKVDGWSAHDSLDWAESEYKLLAADVRDNPPEPDAALFSDGEPEPETTTQIAPAPEPAYTEAPPLLTPPLHIINADAQRVGELVASPVHLVVTSPPYNVGIEYDQHNDSLSTYLPMLVNVWRGCHAVMEEGARICVVVPFGVGRSPYVPFDCQIMDGLTQAGFTVRGRIVWDKNTTGNRTSWGSFRLPSNPALRDTTECIIVAHKGAGRLTLPEDVRRRDEKGTYTEWLADSDYFMELAQDHWVIVPESAQRVKHPAPFPVDLVTRLIHFYGFPGCHVLDPFGGSGTTAVAAKRLGCAATLIELSTDYCALAQERLA